MKSKTAIVAATFLALTVTAPQISLAHAQQNNSQQQGMMQGGNMGQGGMMQSGKMGPGGKMGPRGMMGAGMMGMMMKMRKKMMGKMFMVRKKAYSNEDIKRMIDGRLAAHGFSRLKAGPVKDSPNKGQNAALVDVVSAKGEFLFQVMVNRKTGMAAVVN